MRFTTRAARRVYGWWGDFAKNRSNKVERQQVRETLNTTDYLADINDAARRAEVDEEES